MREIIFRGRSVNSGRWVYGYYLAKNRTDYIVVDAGRNPIRVDPETIGQYVGGTDINGTPIYEGDIVKVITSHDVCEAVRFVNGGFEPMTVHGWERVPDFDDVKVVGNIWENPDLLKLPPVDSPLRSKYRGEYRTTVSVDPETGKPVTKSVKKPVSEVWAD